MKTINVSELKANLSRYLRLASRGARITVRDRDEPIAQIGPPEAAPQSGRERMIASGRLRAGSQNWPALRITALEKPVDIQAALRAVREDPRDLR